MLHVRGMVWLSLICILEHVRGSQILAQTSTTQTMTTQTLTTQSAMTLTSTTLTSPPLTASTQTTSTQTAPTPAKVYSDGRPVAKLRMPARDHGVILRHGGGPGECDALGARDAWVYEDGGTYYLHYDAAGPRGWLCALAISKDLVNWEKRGPVLDFGNPGDGDSAAACYGVTYKEGETWHMFYLGTPNVTPAPDYIPAFPYLTLKARAPGPGGPWVKQPEVVPFRVQPGTYYAETASPGHIVRKGEEYLQFFSASMPRTIGIARTKDLNGSWTVDPKPILPPSEQIENASLYFEAANQTWFLFTNHVGINEAGSEYTDAVWVYWTKDLETWNPEDKAVVLDGENCTWSKQCIGLPAVIPQGNRLAIIYDAPQGNSLDHMGRDLGLAWLELPLVPPTQ